VVLKKEETMWSKPYYGVQHLEGTRRFFQVTACDYGAFTEVYVLAPGSGFTAVAQTSFPTAEEARAWGEKMAVDLQALEPGHPLSRQP
jgi:hypothetical protein